MPSYLDGRDWLDTAKKLAALDAIVTIDTGVAHLAGALGVRTINLIGAEQYAGWFYFPAQSPTTPWYDSMELGANKNIWVGGAAVTSTTGFEIVKGGLTTLKIGNGDVLYAISDSADTVLDVYDFRSRVPTTVDRSDTARAIEGTDRAASSDAPTEYE